VADEEEGWVVAGAWDEEGISWVTSWRESDELAAVAEAVVVPSGEELWGICILGALLGSFCAFGRGEVGGDLIMSKETGFPSPPIALIPVLREAEEPEGDWLTAVPGCGFRLAGTDTDSALLFDFPAAAFGLLDLGEDGIDSFCVEGEEAMRSFELFEDRVFRNEGTGGFRGESSDLLFEGDERADWSAALAMAATEEEDRWSAGFESPFFTVVPAPPFTLPPFDRLSFPSFLCCLALALWLLGLTHDDSSKG